MVGSEPDLSSAISQFVDNKTLKESISISGFNDTIQFDTGFTKDEGVLYSSAKQIVRDGGTNIFSALLYSIGTMPSSSDASKVIIIMTDGMDGEVITVLGADKQSIYAGENLDLTLNAIVLRGKHINLTMHFPYTNLDLGQTYFLAPIHLKQTV